MTSINLRSDGPKELHGWTRWVRLLDSSVGEPATTDASTQADEEELPCWSRWIEMGIQNIRNNVEIQTSNY